MQDQKRFILAIVLIIIVLSVYSLIFKAQPPQKLHPPAREEETEILSEKEDLPVQTKETPTEDYPQDYKISEDAIETTAMRVVLTNKGAYIKEVYLKKHITSTQEDSLKLLRAEDPKEGILAIEEFNQLPLNDVIYKREKIAQNQIAYTYNLKDDWEITKTFIFPKDSYNIDLRIKIANLSKDDKTLSYSLIGASNINKDSMLDRRFTNIGVRAGNYLRWQSLRQVTSLGKENETLKVPGKIEWITFRNTYYSAIIIPYQATSYAFIRWLERDKAEGDQFSIGLKTEELVLASSSSIIHQYTLYAGPTTLSELKPLGLEQATNYGKLNAICQVLIKTLNFFYGVFHNYGLAIIVLVALINIFTYPLTLKNLKSMSQMQAVQPHLARLRETHKDDQRKLQAEMMKLYREHKVNPLGGCLPMLLQMPIFISLYVTLARSAELKGSKFLWIKDLSLPDALAKLPFNIPLLGNTLNLLPIIMIIAMIVQQKISMGTRKTKDAKPQETQQQNMMLMMPVVFGFIFYNLPSGLVLYWTTNTILMALMHYVIRKRLSKATLAPGADWQARGGGHEIN